MPDADIMLTAPSADVSKSDDELQFGLERDERRSTVSMPKTYVEDVSRRFSAK